MGANGATGGNGAGITLNNLPSGSTAGNLTLVQEAFGGNGGTTDGGTPGTAGPANSTLTLTQSGPTLFSGIAQAVGGSGGDTSNTNAGPGAASTASISLTGNNAVSPSAFAGNATAHGGNILAGLNGFTGGAGGDSTANATGSSNNTLTGSSAISGNATAHGQLGGSIPTTMLGAGGHGGAANATAFASSAPDPIPQALTSSAVGGSGGNAAGFGFVSGNGGNAVATATANSTAGPVIATATAQPGPPGAVVNNATPGLSGLSGVATATATATGIGQAQAFATGTSATASARANGSALFSLQKVPQPLTTSAPQIPKASSAAPTPPPTFTAASTVESAAFLNTSPLSSDVVTAWTNDLNARTAFNNTPANVNALMLANLQYPTGGAPSSHTYSTVLEPNEKNSLLNGNNLIASLLVSQVIGSGLQPGDSLRFRIQRQGTTLVDQTLSTNPAFLAYFQNTVFDLGPQNAGLSGNNLDVQFLFDLSISHPGSGVGTQFVIGSDANAPIGIWNNAAGGSWATPTNWSANTLPDGPGVHATFGSVITAPQTVTLDENTTIGSITFSNANPYTIASSPGNNSLTLDNAGAVANITVTSGNHSLITPLLLASPGATVSVPASNTLTLSASITGPANLTLTGPGNFLYAASTGTTKVNALTLNSTSLDITNNKLILEPSAANKSTALSSIQAELSAQSLFSSTLPANFALALLDNALLNLSTFGNQPVDTNSLLLSEELLGDTNIDGHVDLTDLSTILNNFGATTSAWTSGNFDNAPTIDLTDLSDVLNNFGASNPAASASSDSPAADPPLQNAPEPAALAPLALAAALFPRRNRP